MRIGKKALVVCASLMFLFWSAAGCSKDEASETGPEGMATGGTPQGAAGAGSPGGQPPTGGAPSPADQQPPVAGNGAAGSAPPPADTPGDEPPGDQPPGDEPPGDEPPGDEPPGDEPPGDEPPGDEPPGDEPPGDEPPPDQPTGGTDSPPDEPVDQEGSCLQGSGGDYAESGPYEVTTRDVEVPGNGMYTLFYPTNLEADCPHPIAAWGNGTGVTGSPIYAHYNDHAASWGVVVIASHSSESISQPFLPNAIDWLLEQNNDPNSEFYQKLSTKAGAAGHSQGGRAATDATHHPNVLAAVSVGGGHTPAPDAGLMCLTGVADIARERCTQSYDEAQGPAFLADHQDADHFITQTIGGLGTPAGIQYLRLQTAWYLCFLANDDAACELFRGDPCTICNDPGWARIEGKNIP